MTVIRINKTKDYVMMSNYHFKEKQMSLKAKGLLSQMLSLPDDWDYSISGLVAINKENETSIKSTLNELKEFGYLKVTKLMPNETTTGRIEYIYDIYEKKQEGEKQGVENLGVEFLGVENQGQYNINNKIINNKEIKYNKENIKRNEQFEQFYKEYPKKVGKAYAKKSFEKIKITDELFELIINRLKEQKEIWEYNRTNKQYIPNPSTWLNQERWNDELIKREKTSEEKKKEIWDKLLKEEQEKNGYIRE